MKQLALLNPAANLDCGGRAQRRHRFWAGEALSKSGVALHFPPQSKAVSGLPESFGEMI